MFQALHAQFLKLPEHFCSTEMMVCCTATICILTPLEELSVSLCCPSGLSHLSHREGCCYLQITSMGVCLSSEGGNTEERRNSITLLCIAGGFWFSSYPVAAVVSK